MQTKTRSHAAYLRLCALHGYLIALPALPSTWRACALPFLMPSGEQVCAQPGKKASNRITSQTTHALGVSQRLLVAGEVAM